MMLSPAASGGSREMLTATVIPIERFRGRPLVLMLDVDGTLAPIAQHPSLARVPDDTRRTIALLVTRPGVKVALVSGRAAHDARRLVGVEKLWTIGNHGAELMSPGGDLTVDAMVTRYAEPMARVVRMLDPLLEPLRGVVIENKTWTLSVHYRMADASIVPRLRATVDEIVVRNGLRMTDGKKVFEIRPPVAVDKGSAVLRLADDLGALSDNASLFFAGDDETDEDAFRILRAKCPNAVTLRVGPRSPTSAEYVVSSPDDVRELLQRIASDHPKHP